MSELKTFIVDIDGTVANASNRLHLIKTKPKNWKKFFDESLNDEPYEDVKWLVLTLHSLGHNILFVTARPENERSKTLEWLEGKGGFKDKYHKLYMRPAGDYRDDWIVKKDILQEIRNDGYDPFIAFDDRTGVTEMWRSEGISCFQVRGEE